MWINLDQLTWADSTNQSKPFSWDLISKLNEYCWEFSKLPLFITYLLAPTLSVFHRWSAAQILSSFSASSSSCPASKNLWCRHRKLLSPKETMNDHILILCIVLELTNLFPLFPTPTVLCLSFKAWSVPSSLRTLPNALRDD